MYSSTTGVFNIYDYGTPDPTGVTSSSDAINAAAVAAGIVNGGGIVFIPPGNYAIQYSISLPSNVQLAGSDQADTSITAMPDLRLGSDTGTSLTTVMVSNSHNLPGGGSGQQSGIGVRDLTFNGNATVLGENLTTGSGSGAIIEFMLVVDVTVQRCTIYNCQNHAITIDYVNNESGTPVPGDIKILDNTIDVMATPGSAGVNPTGNLSIRVTSYYNVIIRNNVIGYNPIPATWTPLWANDGIDVLHCSDVTISGNQITLVTDGIGCDYGDRFVVTDNIVENYQGYGIRSERVTNAEEAVSHFVVANNVVNASETSGTVSKAGIHVAAGLPISGPHAYPTSHHWTVASNTVIGPTSQGAVICSATNGACTGNSVNLGSLYAFSVPQIGILISGSFVTVTGNEVFDSDGEQQPTSIGIQLMSDIENIIQTISECVVNGNAVDNTAIAVDVNSNISAVSITENNLTNNGVGIQIETGFTLSGCRFAANLGWNPPLPSAITQPGYSTSVTPNTTSYDCMVYVAGTSLTSIKVNGHAIAWPSGTVKGPIGIHVPVNGTIQVGGSGGSWYWTPE